ncbi:AF-9-like [Homarus americanus]|uniref:AF-9-like n=1 Tax=Homarus americanus TaxID=6706 RepID=A0A8J5TJH2_HOMAM|nr:AF-9-like [Homarus americanus]
MSSKVNNKGLNVVVTLELGHRATVRQQRGNEVFTHDWEVFVQGPSGTRIEAFIEKIVFTLHKSFAKPKRVVRTSPYKVSEKGYGSFNLPIEIYFRTNHPDDTRRAQFEYDLFLQNVQCPPITYQRKEKLTFLKPSDDFKKKLLQGGGVIVMGQEDSSQGEKTAVSRPSSGAKIKPHAAPQHQPDTAKKHKHQTFKETKKQESKVSDQFSALFGEPIKKVADQKKPSKEKPPKEKEKVPEKVNENEKCKGRCQQVKTSKDGCRCAQREKETSKRSSSPSSKRSVSPASKRSLSPASKRSLSPASKRSLSPASSIKSDSSAKRKKCETESTKVVVEKTIEETKEKKKEKKKDKKEKRRDKEDVPSVEVDREKPVEKVIVKTESSTKMAAPMLKEERVVLPVKSGDRSPAKERVKVEHKVKKGVHKEAVKEEPVVVTPQVNAKEKKVKEKPVHVPPPAPPRSRSSSKSSSRSLSPSLSPSRSPSPACSRSSSKSSRSRSPPSPASVGRESPYRSPSLSRSRSPARSKSRSRSRSSSGSRRSVSRSPSVSRSKSRSPSRSPTHSRSPSRSRSKSRSRSRSASGSRSQSSSPARSKSRSVSRSPTRSVSSSSSGSSPSPVSVAESQSQVPAPRTGPPRPPLAAGTDSRGPTNPLSIMMKEVSSSSSESEERGSADGKGQVKVPLRSPADASRSSHAPVSQQVSTTPRQIKKEPIISSDDEVTPVVKDNSRVTGKREPITRRPPQREKKKRRSQQDNSSPITTNLPSSSPKETSKTVKEEVKQEDVKGVKEEATATSRLTPEYLQELVELQHKIMNSVDRDQLQQVVDIIAEHSSFQLTHAHFNFDLCSLDAQVVKQLQGCFS